MNWLYSVLEVARLMGGIDLNVNDLIHIGPTYRQSDVKHAQAPRLASSSARPPPPPPWC